MNGILERTTTAMTAGDGGGSQTPSEPKFNTQHSLTRYLRFFEIYFTADKFDVNEFVSLCLEKDAVFTAASTSTPAFDRRSEDQEQKQSSTAAPQPADTPISALSQHLHIPAEQLSLERLREALQVYSGNLQSRLVDLINSQYQNFLGLASGLEGTPEQTASLLQQLQQLREQFQLPLKRVQDFTSELDSRLQQKSRLQAKLRKLQQLQRIVQTVNGLKRLMLQLKHSSQEVFRDTSTSSSASLISDGFLHSNPTPEIRSSDPSHGSRLELTAEEAEELFETELQLLDEVPVGIEELSSAAPVSGVSLHTSSAPSLNEAVLLHLGRLGELVTLLERFGNGLPELTWRSRGFRGYELVRDAVLEVREKLLEDWELLLGQVMLHLLQLRVSVLRERSRRGLPITASEEQKSSEDSTPSSGWELLSAVLLCCQTDLSGLSEVPAKAASEGEEEAAIPGEGEQLSSLAMFTRHLRETEDNASESLEQVILDLFRVVVRAAAVAERTSLLQGIWCRFVVRPFLTFSIARSLRKIKETEKKKNNSSDRRRPERNRSEEGKNFLSAATLVSAHASVPPPSTKRLTTSQKALWERQKTEHQHLVQSPCRSCGGSGRSSIGQDSSHESGSGGDACVPGFLLDLQQGWEDAFEQLNRFTLSNPRKEFSGHLGGGLLTEGSSRHREEPLGGVYAAVLEDVRTELFPLMQPLIPRRPLILKNGHSDADGDGTAKLLDGSWINDGVWEEIAATLFGQTGGSGKAISNSSSVRPPSTELNSEEESDSAEDDSTEDPKAHLRSPPQPRYPSSRSSSASSASSSARGPEEPFPSLLQTLFQTFQQTFLNGWHRRLHLIESDGDRNPETGNVRSSRRPPPPRRDLFQSPSTVSSASRSGDPESKRFPSPKTQIVLRFRSPSRLPLEPCLNPKGSLLFASGNADVFARNFALCIAFLEGFQEILSSTSREGGMNANASVARIMEALRSKFEMRHWRSSPRLASLLGKWKLPLYLQLRRRDVELCLKRCLLTLTTTSSTTTTTTTTTGGNNALLAYTPAVGGGGGSTKTLSAVLRLSLQKYHPAWEAGPPSDGEDFPLRLGIPNDVRITSSQAPIVSGSSDSNIRMTVDRVFLHTVPGVCVWECVRYLWNPRTLLQGLGPAFVGVSADLFRIVLDWITEHSADSGADGKASAELGNDSQRPMAGGRNSNSSMRSSSPAFLRKTAPGDLLQLAADLETLTQIFFPRLLFPYLEPHLVELTFSEQVTLGSAEEQEHASEPSEESPEIRKLRVQQLLGETFQPLTARSRGLTRKLLETAADRLAEKGEAAIRTALPRLRHAYTLSHMQLKPEVASMGGDGDGDGASAGDSGVQGSYVREMLDPLRQLLNHPDCRGVSRTQDFPSRLTPCTESSGCAAPFCRLSQEDRDWFLRRVSAELCSELTRSLKDLLQSVKRTGESLQRLQFVRPRAADPSSSAVAAAAGSDRLSDFQRLTLQLQSHLKRLREALLMEFRLDESVVQDVLQDLKEVLKQ